VQQVATMLGKYFRNRSPSNNVSSIRY